MNTIQRSTNESGFALMVTIVVILIVGLITSSAILVGASNTIGNKYYQQRSMLDAAALEGLEVARARLNGDSDLYPADGYTTLESGAAVKDASGATIPGVERWTYVGPTGQTSGQYGVFGSIVSEVRNGTGGVVIRRSEIYQESFAKYAYFTDIEPSNISFGGGDQIFGPVHTNSDLKIYSSGATFHDETRTAGVVQGESYGTFKKGFTESVSPIDMPETAELNKLRVQATAGGTYFSTDAMSGSGEARMRIEFVALDLDGDGSVTGEGEGFFKVYRSNDQRWVSGDEPSSGIRNSEQCGHYHGTTFVSADDHPNSGSDDWVDALTSASRRCYLGGASEITNGFMANDGKGQWVQWTGAIDPALAGRPDREYLFPLDRRMNPSFKGVIFVDGDVVISGTLRGRVTLVSDREIILGDDLVYASDPGLGTCADILGMFSGNDIVVADNLQNSPFSGYTFDETKDEFFHGIVLALDIFTVEDYAGGSNEDERCEGNPWGRGCLYLTGGIIQNTRGAVGTIWSYGGTGYVKRYSYDKCGATAPPPYFPTTGHFVPNQLFWVDPTGFSASSYYDLLTSN